MNDFFKWHDKMIWKLSKEFNLTKYQVLVITWLEGMLLGVILTKLIF
ncbi:MAG: hypothetical protein ACJ0O6_03435 [Candidatus Marisimplicoccus sp.]|tara:strand:- start:435 stop:575 length:141 start_codon:yes stop_codon:yes gene_type:complete